MTTIQDYVPRGIPHRPRAIYMDGLNFNHKFFASTEWDLRVAYEQVKQFVRAVQNSNIALKVFLDAISTSDEALEKWRSRRMRDVTLGTRGMPQGLSTLMGNMFRKQGIPVLYSEIDCDDALACHAHHDGADVLSSDKDFWRYTGANYTIFFDFFIKNDRLILTPAKPPAKGKLPSPRLIGPPSPVSLNENSLSDLYSDGLYRRGAPSPLIRHMGFNPHIVVQPLRKALYRELFFNRDPNRKETVIITEEFPIWNQEEQRPDWFLEKVTVENPKLIKLDDEQLYDAMLKDPATAFKHFFAEEHNHLPTLDGFASKNSTLSEKISILEWHRHCSACRAVVYELCCLATGQCYFDALVPFAV